MTSQPQQQTLQLLSDEQIESAYATAALAYWAAKTPSQRDDAWRYSAQLRAERDQRKRRAA